MQIICSDNVIEGYRINYQKFMKNKYVHIYIYFYVYIFYLPLLYPLYDIKTYLSIHFIYKYITDFHHTINMYFFLIVYSIDIQDYKSNMFIIFLISLLY